jgi:hypothetical protein
MLYDMSNIDNCAPIVMNLWDKDQNLLSKSYDYVGRCSVFLNVASTHLTMENTSNQKAYGEKKLNTLMARY